MQLQRYLLTLLTIVLSACGPIVIAPVTPNPRLTQPVTPFITQSPAGLPDLIVSNVYLGMQGDPGSSSSCVAAYGPFEIRAMIRNIGQATAFNISVVETSTNSSLQIAELQPRQKMEVYFPTTSSNGSYNVGVDMQNLIPESNENNNMYSYLAPTPTPPVLCTPTPFVTDVTPIP